MTTCQLSYWAFPGAIDLRGLMRYGVFSARSDTPNMTMQKYINYQPLRKNVGDYMWAFRAPEDHLSASWNMWGDVQ
jgi:hypothetical protein